jgi:malonate transporter
VIAAVSAVLPLLAVMGIGFAAAGVPRIAAAEPGLNVFVLWFALPAFLFSAVADAPAGQSPPPWFLPVTVGAPVVIFVCVWLLLRERAAALSAAYGNVGYLGVPVAMSLLGPEAGLAVGVGQLAHNLVFMVGYPLLAACMRERAGAFVPVVGAVLTRAVLLNPVALAVVAGLVLGASPLRLPAVLSAVVDLLATAAVPAALFAVGIALRPAVRSLRSGAVPVLPVCVAAAVKVLVLPAAVLGLLLMVGADMGGQWACTALLLAAMPTSATAYLLAAEHDDAGEEGAAVVFLSSVTALVTIPAAALLVR